MKLLYCGASQCLTLKMLDLGATLLLVHSKSLQQADLPLPEARVQSADWFSSSTLPLLSGSATSAASEIPVSCLD